MTHPDRTTEPLEAWSAANDAAEVAGRAALRGIREALERLAERSALAVQEGKRGSLRDEAEKLDRAIRTAISQAAPNGRPPEAANGEAVDTDHLERVKEARGAEAA